VKRLSGGSTVVVLPTEFEGQVSGEKRGMKPGDEVEVHGVAIRAVPMYNRADERLDYHPKEKGWCGYVVTVGEVTFYHGGDTDFIPEMEGLSPDVAFLPVGGKYTMDAKEAGEAARAIRPGVAVPIHYGKIAGVGTAESARTFAEAYGGKTVILKVGEEYRE
jgi:L-ascorbate metabolism protein UlaG (beta-lactamase superfamily)